jgi:hypothetical protein
MVTKCCFCFFFFFVVFCCYEQDVPSRSSEFAHPDVLIGLTVMAYRYEGIRQTDLKRIVSQLKQDFTRQVKRANRVGFHACSLFFSFSLYSLSFFITFLFFRRFLIFLFIFFAFVCLFVRAGGPEGSAARLQAVCALARAE